MKEIVISNLMRAKNKQFLDRVDKYLKTNNFL